MTNEEREKHIRIASMLIGAIHDLIRPMLMCQIEKDVAKEALENYIKMLEQQSCENDEKYGMNEQMQFPETFEGFAKEYGFKDDKEVYTNGSDLIPIFRVKQWLEQDNKLRAIETDTAYECGKHANRWIPVSERLPEAYEFVNCTCHSLIDDREDWVIETVYIPQPSDSPYSDWGNIPMLNSGDCKVVAWMHRDIPEPYKAESEVNADGKTEDT